MQVAESRIASMVNGMEICCTNETDENDNPCGGTARAVGLSINWQDTPGNPNGSVVEDVLQACINRMEFYQAGKFPCEENHDTLHHLNMALATMMKRRADRSARGVLGKHEE